MAKKIKPTDRRAVRLDRAHLEMLKAFGNEYQPEFRYATYCLHVRRNDEDISVQAMNGPMAAAMPAALVDGNELPIGLAGDEIADGAVAMVGAEAVANVLHALPKKKSTMPIFRSAYLCVDGEVACITVFTPSAQVFRCAAPDATLIPDVHEQVPSSGNLRLRLNAALLGSLCGFVKKHLYDSASDTYGITFDFTAEKTRVTTRLEAPNGFVAVLAPVQTREAGENGDVEPAAHPEAWGLARQAADRKMQKIREEANGDPAEDQ